ncbi:NF038122 family metalloprotease [Bradyrhizobium sp. CCBAU 11434]|uniref:NF038122 family metalloprotease n=1 Tax=Bradyrhizobium sp. CCBAU 11434 TaxID=1630885 RepID=UPI002305311A|nr:NF038122 family metalloprotease [Bradyrhizobium sp. CCBAU 11434]
MRSKSTPDEVSDDSLYTVVGDRIQGSYIPAASEGSASGGTTTGSVLSVTAGGIIINLVLDAAAQAAPASFKSGLQQAVAILAANITDKITVNINIDYSGTGGGAAAGPDSGLYENYSWVHSELVNHASPGDTAFNSLPSGTAIQGQSNVAVWNAQLKLWGVIGANDTTTDDASAYFSTDINSNLLVGVALHELSHAMGRVPYGSAPDVFDFYRFTSPGVHLFSGAQTAPAAYFSLDGGNTKLADYGQSSDPSDFLNSGVQGPNDPFNEYYTSNTIQGLTAIDLKQLDALGFHVAASTPTTIEAYGATSLVQAGNGYFLNPTVGGTGPEVMLSGSPLMVDQFSGWAPVAAEKLSSGYELAMKSNSGQFIIWTLDGNGNYLTNAASVSGTSTTLENHETIFHQDLNGDGIIGIPATTPSTTIESFGATSLIQVGSNYLLNPTAGGSGPEVTLNGAALMAGQFSGWAPVGAEKLLSGYELAMKSNSGQFIIWTLDGNGNYLTNAASVSGTSTTLENHETSFHQDLNGDGIIGIPATTPSTTIESFGATSLVQVGSNYFLNPTAGGSGPEVMLNGAPLAAGQFSGWSPVAAEKTSTGFIFAMHSSGADQFIIWTLDSNGNYVTNTAAILDSSVALKSYESSFQQDLNGDGVISPAAAASGVHDTSVHYSADLIHSILSQHSGFFLS